MDFSGSSRSSVIIVERAGRNLDYFKWETMAMYRFVAALLACFALVMIVGPQPARAQQSVRTRYRNSLLNRPTVSPYLNLVRRDGSLGASNYQTLVRPQLEARQNAFRQQQTINNVQRQVNTLQTDFRQSQALGTRQTGHPTRFMTYSHYYPSLGR